MNGDDSNTQLKYEDVGHASRLPGMIDSTKFDVFAMKNPDYTMMIMSSYSCLPSKSGQKESVRDDEETMRKFKYTETVANYFDYHGAVDFHNAKRHGGGTNHGISIDEICQTTNWTLRFF